MTRRQQVLEQRGRDRQQHKHLQMAGLATGALSLGYSVNQLTGSTWSVYLEPRQRIGRKDELIMIASSSRAASLWQEKNRPLPEVPPLLTDRFAGLLKFWQEPERDKVKKEVEAKASEIIKTNFEAVLSLADKLEGGQLAGHTIRSVSRNMKTFEKLKDL